MDRAAGSLAAMGSPRLVRPVQVSAVLAKPAQGLRGTAVHRHADHESAAGMQAPSSNETLSCNAGEGCLGSAGYRLARVLLCGSIDQPAVISCAGSAGRILTSVQQRIGLSELSKHVGGEIDRPTLPGIAEAYAVRFVSVLAAL